MAQRTATTATTAAADATRGMPRRQFVRLVVLGAGTAVLPLACGPSPEPEPDTPGLVPPLPGYFSIQERRLRRHPRPASQRKQALPPCPPCPTCGQLLTQPSNGSF